MVLKSEENVALRLIVAAAGLAGATNAYAAAPSVVAPAVGEATPNGLEGMDIGAIKVFPGLSLGTAYDSNILATPTNRKDDVSFLIMPEVTAQTRAGGFNLDFHAAALISQYVESTTENSVGATTLLRATMAPNAESQFTLSGGWDRSIENRGDTEARQNALLPPRKTDILSATLNYRKQGKILFETEIGLRKYNVLSSLEEERDFTSYLGKVTVGYRAAGTVYGTLTAFANRRDARLAVSSTGLDRDANTYGARLGISISPGGLLEGSIGAGIFHLNPDDPTIRSRNGFSLEGSLTYHVRRRTAILLSAFNGDVATFRNGAQSRNDTRVRIDVQQEIRHNLFGAVGVGVRRTKFVGTAIHERTTSGTAQLEWRANKLMSVIAETTYTKRTSNDPFARYDRFRGGVSVSFRF